MQSSIRALLYGIVIWFIWVSLIVASAEILPAGIAGSPLFVSMQMVALAALVLGFTILYLRNPSYVVMPIITTLTIGYLKVGHRSETALERNDH